MHYRRVDSQLKRYGTPWNFNDESFYAVLDYAKNTVEVSFLSNLQPGSIITHELDNTKYLVVQVDRHKASLVTHVTRCSHLLDVNRPTDGPRDSFGRIATAELVDVYDNVPFALVSQTANTEFGKDLARVKRVFEFVTSNDYLIKVGDILSNDQPIVAEVISVASIFLGQHTITAVSI